MVATSSGFYSFKDRHTLDNAVKNRFITETEYALLKEYLHEMQARDQLSENRVQKLITTLLGWRKNRLLTTEYHLLEMKDLYSGIINLRSTKNQKGRPFSQNTQYDYVTILKKFLIWTVKKQINPRLNETEIKEIKNPAQDNDVTHPDEILDPDDITKMITACLNSRDRAIISVHYEAATRIGELGRLQWRDVLWDEYGAQVRITDTKTKKYRQVRITSGISCQYLTAWRNDYPGTPEGSNFVFVSLDRGHPITYGSYYKLFKTLAARAKIQKPISTHIFRKSRGTHLIEQGLPISNLIEMMWGNQSTRQIKTYVKLSPVEQDRVMLQHSGVISDEQSKAKERRMSGRICPECHTQNTVTSRFCDHCGTPLDDETIREAEILRQAMKDPVRKRKILESALFDLDREV
jgi:site-specific recombinase XerD